jgi:hypothetical protein
MLFTFKIMRTTAVDAQPINYILRPMRYPYKVRNRPDPAICLITSPKNLTKFRKLMPQLKIESHIMPIFGLLRP